MTTIFSFFVTERKEILLSSIQWYVFWLSTRDLYAGRIIRLLVSYFLNPVAHHPAILDTANIGVYKSSGNPSIL